MKITYYILIFFLYVNPLFATKIELIHVEQEYLSNNSITYAGDPNWLPFEAFDKNGNYAGIIAEHIEILEKNSIKSLIRLLQKIGWILWSYLRAEVLISSLVMQLM